MTVYAEQCISIPGQTLFYYKTGSGGAPLLVFHGYGQTHTAFDTWVSRLAKKYTLFLVDLYFHGKSSWTDTDTTLEIDVWKRVVSRITEQENISTFSLAGYSLGGKFALATLAAFPDRVKEIYLIAPDGITRNFWYSLATWPVPMRKLFRSIVRNERRYVRLTSLARRWSLADRMVLRFVETQMNTAPKRERVYNTWVVFRHLRFDMDEISDLIGNFNTPVTVIAGRYDRIIPPAALRARLNRLKNVTFHVVDSGHNDLILEALPFLSK